MHAVEVGYGGDVAPDGAPREPRLPVKDPVGGFTALRSKGSVGDVFDEEEEELVLRDGIKVAKLPPLVKGLECVAR